MALKPRKKEDQQGMMDISAVIGSCVNERCTLGGPGRGKFTGRSPEEWVNFSCDEGGKGCGPRVANYLI